jgi:hypothetical protein
VTGNLPPHATAPNLSQSKQKLSTLTQLATKLDNYIDQLGYIKDFSFQYDVGPKDLTSIESKLQTLKDERDQVEQIADQIMADPVDGYNKALPNFDFDKIPGPLPAFKPQTHVPISVEVVAGKTTYSGDGEDWVGESKLPIKSLHVKFLLPSFTRPNAPLILSYNALTKRGTDSADHSDTGWIPSTTSPDVEHIYAIAFKLDGSSKDSYYVEYKGILENGMETPTGQDGSFISITPTDVNNQTPPGYALSQLQLRIISKL